MIEDPIITRLEWESNYCYLTKSHTNKPLRNYYDSGESFSESFCIALFAGEALRVHHCKHSEYIGVITEETCKEALGKIEVDFCTLYNEIVMEEGDAETADIFFQLAVMGEVVYG